MSHTQEKYSYTDDMAEISGFGGGYEATCRAMVVAGLKWFDEHPGASPEFRGYSGIYGVINEENSDAKELTKAVIEASGGDCTGAMHQATISHILWIHNHSWDQYAAESRERRKAKEQQ